MPRATVRVTPKILDTIFSIANTMVGICFKPFHVLSMKTEYLLLVTTVIPLKCFIHVCFFRTEFLRDSIPCRIFLLEQNDIRAFFNYIRGTLENNGSSSNTVDLVNVRSPKEFTGAILAPPEYPTEHAQRLQREQAIQNSRAPQNMIFHS